MSKKIASLYAEISADTTKLKTGLDQGKQQLTKFKLSITDLYSGVQLVQKSLTAVGHVAKVVMEFGREGAQLDYLRGKFDNLSESIGVTSDSLLIDLKNATGGIRSEAELVASAGDLMALGLAKSRDEVVRLTKVAGGLNMDMNQLVLTLANQTTMRFDQLGVSVDGFKEKVDALKESGMTASDAFKEAFLQQAEEQLRKVGDAADSGAGAFLRMDAALKDFSDRVKKDIAPTIGTLADNITFLAKDGLSLENIFKQLKHNQYEYSVMVMASQPGMKEWGQRYQGMADAINKNKTTLDSGTKQIEAIGLTAEEAAELLQSKLEKELDNLSTIVDGKVGKTIDEFTQKQKDLTREIETTKRKIEILNEQPYLTQQQKEELDGLKSNLGELQTEFDKTAKAHEEAMKTMAFNMLQERAASDGLTESEVRNLTTIAQQWGLWDEKTAEVVQAINDHMDELNTANPQNLLDIISGLMGLPDTKLFKFNIEVNGLNDLMRLQAYQAEPGPDAPVVYDTGGEYVTKDKRAAGGPVSMGMSYLVGERGPEIFTPSQSGNITPNNRLGGVTINGGVTVIANNPTEFMAQLGRMARQKSRAGADKIGA